MSESKNHILQKIRKGLEEAKIPQNSQSKNPIKLSKFVLEDTIDVEFASTFTQAGGYFFYCEKFENFFAYLIDIAKKRNWYNIYCWNNDLVEYFQRQDFRSIRIGHILDKAHAGITTCDFLIAENGGIMVSSQLPCGRMLPIYPPNWLIVATVSQLVESKEMAWQKIKEKYTDQNPTMISVISNSAQTRLFEGRIQKGGIGPQNIFLFLIDDDNELVIPQIESKLDRMTKENLENKQDTKEKQ